MDQPGLLFVAATFLPLASFGFLLLVGAVRFACRRTKDQPGLAATIFHALGGDVPARWPAFVATGAIAAAFVCCVAGAIQFFPEQGLIHERQHELKHLRDEKSPGHGEEAQEKHAGDDKHADDKHAKPLTAAEKKAKIAALEQEIAARQARWQDHIEWASLLSASSDPEKPLQAQPQNILTLGYRLDNLNVIMFLMVTLIATLIHLFSSGYMVEELQKDHEDHQAHVTRRGRFGRFFMFLSLFCFSMLNLILADNLFQVFLSWELVGVCSYFLIGFYYERNSASTAAIKAFVTNRVGDAGFILGLLIVWSFLGTFNFEEIFARLRTPEHHSHGASSMAGAFVLATEIQDLPEEEKAEYLADNIVPLRVNKPDDPTGVQTQVVIFPRNIKGHFHAPGHGEHEDDEILARRDPTSRQFGVIPFWLLTVAGLGIFLGCVGKSAQFPLHVWLPDAMEGPTPVSALIHAATMVAAGVYLVGRVFPIFTGDALLTIAYCGAITLVIGATIAVAQTDIKKVLAYSTVSQLGYMMLGLGVGGWVAGLFHLVTHAFFKALMFLGSGSVIYGCHHEQDMGKMGGLLKKMPITALTMLVGVLAICGIPLFSGWYSKDAILASAAGFVFFPKNSGHFLLLLLPLAGAGLTTFYMFRMWFMTFTGKPKDQHVHDHAKESPWMMTLPLVVLAVFSVIVAWGPLWEPGNFFHPKFPFINAESSVLEDALHHAAPEAVLKADYEKPITNERINETVHIIAHEMHYIIGLLALLAVVIGFSFSFVLYYLKALDPEEAKQQAPGVHRFLWNKWYFDELYSVALVRPALVFGYALKWVDANVIDGLIHGFAWTTIRVSKWDGLFDRVVVDGLVNLIARVVYGVGGWFRTFQTGYLRNYVLFLVLAAVAIFVLVSYFVARVMAGG